MVQAADGAADVPARRAGRCPRGRGRSSATHARLATQSLDGLVAALDARRRSTAAGVTGPVLAACVYTAATLRWGGAQCAGLAGHARPSWCPPGELSARGLPQWNGDQSLPVGRARHRRRARRALRERRVPSLLNAVVVPRRAAWCWRGGDAKRARFRACPAERFSRARMRAGLRYARHAEGLRTVLVARGALPLSPASALWALLPPGGEARTRALRARLRRADGGGGSRGAARREPRSCRGCAPR